MRILLDKTTDQDKDIAVNQDKNTQEGELLKTLLVGLMKDILREMLVDNEVTSLMAKVAKKYYEELLTAGFDKEQAMSLVLAINKNQ